ncbi:uncharacterized protein LOC113055374 isoform X2 [Carassius auratus]|uniref:Uncharacterized protein LOC113055374 isoform X2 n=1 Tax=Carassius auratus TaxID=7957 RepID=A0A6P6KYX7_CARAU|nr:uncharacterized protein LOC113055374 isoform X2 [Carassius auratus]
MALLIFIILQLSLEVKLQGLATMSSLPPITDVSPTTVTPIATFQDMSNLSTQDIVGHSLTDPANASLELTTLTDTTERASAIPLMTKGPEIRKYLNTKMFFLIAVVASGGGIVLTALVGICLNRCTGKSKPERIWIKFSGKKQKQGLSLPTACSDSFGEEDTVLYSTINFNQSPSQPPGNSDESMQNEVEVNQLYYTVITEPTISSDSSSVYSQLKVQ